MKAAALIKRLTIFVLSALLFNPVVQAGHISIAVTSNFDFTLEELKTGFETATGHTVSVSPGPSSQHYAQILNGADYDIFLADDVKRPTVLESNDNITTVSRFTYARGRLVLWSVNTRPLSMEVLQTGNFRLLAVANPLLAPYGQAAKEFLDRFNLWEPLQEQIVVGENIGQTYHFGISGDVDMALIAFSQIIYGDYLQAGSYWPIPDAYYSPIEQQGLLLTENPAAREFINFMQSDHGRQIIVSNGYYAP